MATTDERTEQAGAPADVSASTWGRWDSIALAAVSIVGALLRFIRLDNPKLIIFDEVYYAKDACWYVNVSEKICETASEQSNVHPPLGKWLIAIGIRLFDHNSFGWRVAAAVAGTVTIALVYLLARRILRSTMAATLASGLLAFDLLHFVQSRIAMLDIFVPMFGIAAILFVVYDRDRYRPEPDGGRGHNGLLDRPWRLAAGACGGAAVACKWSGIFYLVMAIVLTIVWELAARREDGGGRVFTRALLQESLSIIVWFLALPIGLYLITYLGRLEVAADQNWWQAFWDRHVYMFNFHRNLESTHGYQSPPWSWLLIKRPVSYFYERRDGNPAEIFAAGSPFVWWAAILAIVYLTVRWVMATIRSVRTPGGTGSFRRAEGVILAGFVLTYGPWLLPLSDRSAVFIFYLLPTIPFMCLALAYVASEIGTTWEAKAAIGLFAAGTIGLFAFYYPLTANVAIPQGDWDRRIWIFNKCDKPEGTPTTSTITDVTGTKTKIRTTETRSNADIPPNGWCWI